MKPALAKNHTSMKRKLNTLFVALATAFAATTFTASAQIITVSEQTAPKGMKAPATKFTPKIDTRKFELKSNKGGIKTYAPSKAYSAKRKAKAAASTVTVTCKIEYDESKYYGGGVITLGNKDFSKDYYAEADEHLVTCTGVPVGTYDFLTNCWTSKGGLSYHIKENVAITKDTTLVFSMAECTNKAETALYKKDGSKATLPVYILDENWNIADTVDVGTINSAAFNYQITIGSDVFASYFRNADFEIFGEESGTLYTNSGLSNRVRMTMDCCFSDETDHYIVSKTANDRMSLIKNDYKDFVYYQEKFVPTPSNSAADGTGGKIGFDYISSVNDVNAGGMSAQTNTKAPDGVVSLYVDAPKNTDKEFRFNTMVLAKYLDKQYMFVDEWEYEDENGQLVTVKDTSYYYGALASLPAFVSKEGVEYVNSGHDAGGNFAFHRPVGGGDIMEYPGNPAFAFTTAEKALDFGSGCPINAIMAQNSWREWVGGKMSFLDGCYIGRYGEVRTADNLVSPKTMVTYNKETVVCDDYTKLEQAMADFAMQHNPDGVINVEMENTNIAVDGLPGRNLTQLEYDWRKEDWTAPTMQMLWFKDGGGMITDRFATAADGTLEFAAGDFNFYNGEDGWWFDCAEQTCQVSYAPYNTGSWTELPVTEVPEKYFMPGFGHFYTAQLAGVKGEAERGWFDLKIRLTDTAGNWQEQTISPAFRIDALTDTGISYSTAPDAAIKDIYSISGRKLYRKHRGLNIVRTADGRAYKVVEK